MSVVREKRIKKTREELIKEYCERANVTEEYVETYLKSNNKTDKCLENLAKRVGISLYQRQYIDLERDYKIEIKQGDTITSSFIATGVTVERAIKARTGYSVALEQTTKSKADMIVTIVGSEMRVNRTTKKVKYYKICSTHIYKGRKYQEVDWVTGERVEKKRKRGQINVC